MKKILLTLVLFVPALLAISQTRTVDAFQKIDANGDVRIVLISSNSYALEFNGKDEAPKGLNWSINNGTLSIAAKRTEETDTIKVMAPSLEEIKLNSVATASTEGVFKANSLKLIGDGASEFNMNLSCETIALDFQGATEANLQGNANTLTARLSGASDVKAYNLNIKEADIYSDGAAEITLTVSDKLKAYGSGASDITYSGNPTDIVVDTVGASSIRRSDEVSSDSETPAISNDSDCSNSDENMDDNDDEFNGHWAGLGLMMNTFMSNYGVMNTAPSYAFMETEFSRSLGIQLNFMEFNYNIIKEKVGITTGLGLSIMNYRLGDEVRLTGDSVAIFSNPDALSNTIRSKLTVSYLTLPLMFELQSNNGNNSNSFHFGIGVFGGVKVGSHSKIVTNDGGKDNFKSQDDFHLNPFRYGAMVRLGWNSVNLFAQYSISEMFQAGEGPVVYPMEFGFSFDLN